MDLKVLGLLIAVCYFGGCSALTSNQKDCRVSSFKVMQDFDKYRYTGTWYAVDKKDPQGLFFLDDIIARFSIDKEKRMQATTTGRIIILGIDICTDMMSTFYETEDPAKFIMTYRGLEPYLPIGVDNYWIIETDYNNYSIVYSCREEDEKGECKNSYSLVFSRNKNGLTPEEQRIVRKRQDELCLARQYRPVAQNGVCNP